MVKLTYTDDMRLQDELWKTEEENVVVMERLQKHIVQEAKVKGFKGATETIVYGFEVITEVFESMDDLINERETGNGLQIASCGFCKSLIECLEHEINES